MSDKISEYFSKLSFYDFPEKKRCAIVNEETCDEIINEADIVIFSPLCYSLSVAENFVSMVRGKEILLDLPVESRGKDTAILSNIVEKDYFSAYVANNIYAFELCKGKKILCGAQLNLLNNNLGLKKIISIESAENDDNYPMIIFGRAVLMNLTHCPRRQLGLSCSSCSQPCGFTLTDSASNNFELRRHHTYYCYWEVLNSKVLNLSPVIDPARHTRLIVDARNVDKDKALAVLKSPFDNSFDASTETRGRFLKGVK